MPRPKHTKVLNLPTPPETGRHDHLKKPALTADSAKDHAAMLADIRERQSVGRNPARMIFPIGRRVNKDRQDVPAGRRPPAPAVAPKVVATFEAVTGEKPKA